MGFDELGLGPDVLRAISDVGYETPTPIQEQSIPAALTGRDILGCAQTGTGKTASFVLPMIEILSSGRARARMPRSLILTPTRELAMQISNNFDEYGKFHKLTQALLIGGVSMDEQSKKLGRGVDVLIATPGRLIDHFESGRILMSDIKVLVIDEADRMLDMGFIPDVEKIVGQLPKIRQTLFFSATMPAEIRRLADAFLMNPREIHVAPPASPAETVIQRLAVVGTGDKRKALRRIIESEDVQNALVFCNRKRDVDILYRSLRKHDLAVAALHGDMAQPVRLQTLEAFRNNEVRILVASDVAARGLDIVDLSHVFNFDVPYNPEDYIHRIGRTGRAGKEGRAFTIATPEDAEAVSAIARLLGKEIPGFEVAGLERGKLGEPAEKRTRKPRASKVKAKPEKKKASAAEPKPAPARRERRRPGKKEPAESVVGMGSHVPAFLLRPGGTGEAG
ncbi:MAG: DEAD/DEAH box helicase [Defluviicoccus sp.]|nr:DEAD/DEAH box helicase [Defluviicoccus sp.]